MSDPKTKHAAEVLIARLEGWAETWDDASIDPYADKGSKRVADAVASEHRKESERLRALLPSLPD